MGEHETTKRMQRPALLGLLHELLEHDFVTAKVHAPAEARDLNEAERVTAIIAVPRIARTPRHIALGFVAAFLIGFALTFSLVSA
jgi:hypothetical protein